MAVNILHPTGSRIGSGFFTIGKAWALALCLALGCSTTHAQQLAISNDDKEFTEMIGKLYTASNEELLEALQQETDDKKLLRYYKENYKYIFASINKQIQNGSVFNIPVVVSALKQTLANISAQNPDAPKGLQVLLLRSDMPNALTVGDKFVYVNIGIYAHLDNDAQIAAVLCHEVAHLMLRHTMKVFLYHYKKNQDQKEAAKQLREVSIGRSDRAFELVRGYIYQGLKLSRTHELEADSAGYILYRKLGYPPAEYTRALAMLEKFEDAKPDGLKTESYKRFFHLPLQPFNDKWLQGEDFSAYNYNAYKPRLDKDSVESHPKSKERIAYIYKLFPETADAKTATPTAAFTDMKTLAQNHWLPNLYINEYYGLFVYYLLVQLQASPDNKQYKEWLGKGFEKIHEARKAYQLNKYVDVIAPKDQTKSYMEFLNFIWNLKPEELEKIKNYYNAKG